VSIRLEALWGRRLRTRGGRISGNINPCRILGWGILRGIFPGFCLAGAERNQLLEEGVGPQGRPEPEFHVGMTRGELIPGGGQVPDQMDAGGKVLTADPTGALRRPVCLSGASEDLSPSRPDSVFERGRDAGAS
jgi:hypothetical protein